jgi:hypothetical protein
VKQKERLEMYSQDYGLYLFRDDRGEPDEHYSNAYSLYETNQKDIEVTKDILRYLIVGIWVLAAVIGPMLPSGLACVVLMNMAAFHCGKYSNLSELDTYRFEDTVRRWFKTDKGREWKKRKKMKGGDLTRLHT